MKARSTGSGGFRPAYYTDDEFMYDDDMDYIPPARKKTVPISGGGKERPGVPKRPAPAQSPPPGAGGQSTSPGKGARSRPTNNQLLYKAYFRWAHYPHKLKNANLPVETDACASVTAAFLQVLQIMQTAEQLRHGSNKRNVLQILSSNTRRTKVVELSSGTHRVPDELKKHYLSDGEGGQYSTNLDRNRYGNDDNYLFTVIRYDLEFLGLCPCMVDVEIIDAKQGNTSIIVSAGTEVCTCQGGPPMGGEGSVVPAPVPSGAGAAAHHHHHAAAAAAAGHHHLPVATATVSGGGHHAIKVEYSSGGAPHGQVPAPTPSGGNGGFGGGAAPDVGSLPQLYGPGAFRAAAGLPVSVGRESPKRSGTSVSQLFDALVMAATGGADGAAAAGGLGGEPPVTSPAHADRPERGTGAGGGTAAGAGGGGGPRLHGPPGRNKSKLWSLNNLSYGGEVDSLQNALDAFREQDEIASGDPAAFLTGGASAGGPDGGLQRSDSLRQRRRKPLRNSSILGRPASSGGMAAIGSKPGMSLREKSDDNLKLAADPDLAVALAAGAMGGGASFQAGSGLPGGGLPHGHGATQVSSLASGEDDNDGGGDGDADDALAAKGEDLGVEGEGEAGGEEDGQEEGGVGTGGVRGLGGAGGPTASGTLARASALSGGRSPLRHHVRHVPRQSSVANLGPRVANSSGGGTNMGGAGGQGAGGGPMGGLGIGMLGQGGLGGSASAAIAGEQLRRLANELDVIRHENRNLRQQLQRANSTSANVNGNGGGGGNSPGLGGKQQQQQQQLDNNANNESARLRKLEAELLSMRSELFGLSGAKKSADEENKQLKRELLVSQQQVAALLTRVLGAGPGAAGLGASPAPSGSLPAGLVASLMGSAGAPTGPAAQQPQAAAFDPSSLGAQFVGLRQVAAPQQHLTEATAAHEARAGGAAATGGGAGTSGQGDFAVGPDVRPDDADEPHYQGRKRTAEEAGLLGAGAAAEAAAATGTDVEAADRRVAATAGAVANSGKPVHSHVPQQLTSMPTFSPAAQLAPSVHASQQPADSGAAATPADSFSDVAQLLALPNLDNGFTSSELAGPFGASGIGGAAGFAASSGLPAPGSGSGSGTASVPQMPQSEQQQLLPALFGHQHPSLR